MGCGMSVCRTYGLSSKEDGTFSDSDGGGGASELDMADAYSDKHHKKLEADMNTSIARKELVEASVSICRGCDVDCIQQPC